MLPTEAHERKAFPLLTVLTAYFPDAIEALVGLCKQGNVQHAVDKTANNPFRLPNDQITWDRAKSTDQTETLMRHLWDHERAKRGGNTADMVDNTDGHLHIVKALWRAAAEAQLTIEALTRKPPERLANADVFEVSSPEFDTEFDILARRIQNALRF